MFWQVIKVGDADKVEGKPMETKADPRAHGARFTGGKCDIRKCPWPPASEWIGITQFYAISFQLAFVLLPGLKKQPVEKVSRIHVLHIHQWDNFWQTIPFMGGNCNGNPQEKVSALSGLGNLQHIWKLMWVLLSHSGIARPTEQEININEKIVSYSS